MGYSHKTEQRHGSSFCWVLLLMTGILVNSVTGISGVKAFALYLFASENIPIPPLITVPNLEELDEKYSTCNGVDIRELSITQFQELFDTGRLTSVALTNCYIERIHQLNHILRVVIEINPDAIEQATRADLERSRKQGNSSLMLGIPILLKGNVATNDLMNTTAGSLALVGIRPKRDADVVSRLRKSGAVILGKANLSEFANFRGINIPSGWSGYGGQTRNAYNLNAAPSGSSSGSAQSVAANLAVASVGTETDGSLISPASRAGICTIKPTHGMPSIRGIIPISHNQDHVGPMTKSVMDAAILLDAMLPEGHYMSQLLNPVPRAERFRVGVLRHPFWNNSVINSTELEFQLPQLESMLDLMKASADFEVLDLIEYPTQFLTNISNLNELIVMTHDCKYGINEYLKNEVINPPPVPGVSGNTALRQIATLKDIIQFNIDNPVPEGYNQLLLELSEATDGLENRTYIEARDVNRGASRALLDYVLKEYQLDAVVTPSENRREGTSDPVLESSPIFGYSLAAISGYPSVNLPAGIGLKGVPFGVTFIGLPFTESILLEIAHEIEQMDPRRQRPRFLI